MEAAPVAASGADTDVTMTQSADVLGSESVALSDNTRVTSIESPRAAGDASEVSADSAGQRAQQRANYSVKKKRELIALAKIAGVREVCRMEGIPRRTLRHWLDDADKINSFEGPDTRKSIGRSGRREILPFGRELSAFLEEGRREGRDVTSSHMIDYIRQSHAQWLEGYMSGKKSAESGQAALARLCQRFVERHGFTHTGSAAGSTRRSATTSMTSVDTTSTESRAPVGQSTAPVPPSRELQPAIEQSNALEYEPNDDSSLLFGLDIGTTAIKCVVVKAEGGQTIAMANVSLADVTVPTKPGEDVVENRIGVQNVDQVLLAVQGVVSLLPETARRRVTSIGICGQMHGILWWCSRAVHEAAERLLATGGHPDDDTYEPAWSELITWQDQRCSPAFLENCRIKIARSKPTGNASPPCKLAAGYGLASFAHTLENSPRTLVGMDACGTIHDFVAFVLCGHTLPSETFMDTTDAHSWGGLNLQTRTWDNRVLRALRIPSSMLPAVKKPGTCVGHSSTGHAGFGLPASKPVCVPMGDHPCSVLAALSKRQSQPGSESNITLVNIGTSAQMAMVLTGADVAKLSSSSKTPSQDKSSFEVRPFLTEDRYLGVAASLSGGNTFAWLVQQWQQWTKEMGLTPANNDDNEEQQAQREAEIYSRLIGLGLQREETELTFAPTLNGERADPDATGSIVNLRMNNWSMGDISAALCRGLVDNLFAMIPTELQSLISAQPMIGTGNALVRNELLQRFLVRRLAQPQSLLLQTAADAAVGAALAPSLLGGRPLVLNV
ncbi:FGGY family of carbohydrate kinases C-terminal domain [Phytophthora infestans]|uniref:FGGY family of carbohydrate kinases C-terminal domain n=1 Tax=Phytophthora infestans TaxID=4787 RepID=A0A833WCI6_PHYIN|nr:FGGY family of carbohydrate kinases C-terminal domain [Phytophthora infestans]